MLKKIRYSILTVTIILVTLLSLFIVPTLKAESTIPSFVFKDSGSKIDSKIRFGNSTSLQRVVFLNTGSSNIYTGEGKLYDSNTNSSCSVGLTITLTGENYTDFNNQTGAGGILESLTPVNDTDPLTCNESEVRFFGYYESGKVTVAITGSTSDTTSPTDTPEALDETIVTINIPKNIIEKTIPNKIPGEPPITFTGVTVVITDAENTGFLEESKIVSLLTDPITTSFDSIPGGIYNICLHQSANGLGTKPTIADVPDCERVEKIVGSNLTINFGEAFKSKVVANVEIEVADNIDEKSFGPLKINLIKTSDNSVIKSSDTENETYFGSYNATLSTRFDDVPAGNYKVCIADTTFCSAPFSKVDGVLAEGTIIVPRDQSDQFNLIAGSISTTSCAVDGIGWIVCPILNFMAYVADGTFDVVKGFLVTSPNLTNTDTTNGIGTTTYDAWQSIRNIANIIFVIFFLIIIFSQLTNIGVTNYGIKKMLPRLVIAAILVNLSFLICQIAIDLSNIIGYSIQNLLENILPVPSNNPGFGSTGAGWGGIVSGVLTSTLAIGIIISTAGTLIPVLIAVIVSIIMILFILIARQALIVMLVILAPLAFVSFLLPNTAKFFTTWRKALVAMLILFPIVAFVFGGSRLASTILTSVFTSPGNNNWFGQIAAAAITTLPLFVVPGLLKSSLNGIGKIGEKIGSVAGGASGAARKKYEGSSYGKFRQGEVDKENALIRSGAYAGKSPFKKFSSKTRKTINENERFDKLTGGYGTVRSAAGIQLADAQNTENIKRAAVRHKFANLNKDETRVIATGGTAKGINGKDTYARSAAIQDLVASNDIKGINDLWDESRSWTSPEDIKLRNVLADSLQSSSSRPAYIGAGAIATMRTGEHGTHKQIIESAITNNAYSPTKIAAADKDELTVVAQIAHNSTNISLEAHQNIVNNAYEALTDPRLKPTIGKNIDIVNNLSKNELPKKPLE